MTNCVIDSEQINDVMAEILDLSADAVISLDANHNIVLVNAAFERIFGYPSDEILGQSLNILLPKSIHAVHKTYIASYDKSADKSRYMGQRSRLVGISKSGDEIPLDIAIQKHPEGSLCRYTAICRDISHRIEQEQRVKEEEEKFRALFNTSHHFIILMDGNSDVVEFNDTALRVLEQNTPKNIGKKLWDCEFWASEVDVGLITDAMSRIEEGENISLIVQAIGSRNNKITVEITLKRIWVELKETTFIVLEGKDISNILQTNKALAASEARLARAQKIAHIGNWEWTLPTNELIWSDEIYRIFGLPVGQFGNSYEAFISAVHPDDRELVEENVAKALKDDVPYHITHRIVLPDQTVRIVEERAEIIRMEDGAPVQMIGTVQDITESWNRERELQLAKKRAEDANIAKAQFLSSVSHELRTPLNAIIGFSSMIMEEQLGKIDNKYYLDYAVDINNSGRDLLNQIQNILNITSYELGALKNNPRDIAPKIILDNVLPPMIQRAAEKNIRIQTFVDDDIPIFHLDPDHTQQILIHLIDNAIKFSNDDDVIDVNLLHEGGNFILEVIDQGIGIEVSDADMIFEQFVQKEMNYNKVYGGCGVGLTIVRNLTELQSGHIEVDSNIGSGSRITVRIPCGCEGPET